MTKKKTTNAKRITALAASALLMLSTPVVLTGCMGGGGGGDSTAENAITVAQTSYQIEENAVNNMCNGAMKFTVTGMQRRPTSVFSGADIQGGNQGMDGTSDSQVGAAASTDIAIQVDVSYTWNVNTYIQAVTAAGGQASSTPSSLGDVLVPGTLMYVSGSDADGNPYMSADIISPSAQEDVNALAINAQWDYDVLNSPLPETSVTKTGSFLLRVPSTVNNLKLVIVTPMAGQDFTNLNNIGNAETYMYELPLT